MVHEPIFYQKIAGKEETSSKLNFSGTSYASFRNRYIEQQRLYRKKLQTL